MTATSVSGLPRAALQGLVEAYPFKPYRQYRAYSRREQQAILLADIDATLAVAGEFSHVTSLEAPRAAVIARPLPWDSTYFGVPMGRLDYVLTSPEATAADRRDVVAAACTAARDAGLRHLTARVDVGDLVTLAVLEDAGFRTMDALATYIMRPGKDVPRGVRSVGPVRLATLSDADAVLEITREAYRGYRGRFHLDANIPPGRADGFYEEWARQCLAGVMADLVMVSEDSAGRVIGYLAHRRRQPASTIGMPIYGGGLGACRRDAPGAYASLIRDSAVWAHERGAVAECQTQNANFPVIRVYESVGFHYVRAEYTLHAWLG